MVNNELTGQYLPHLAIMQPSSRHDQQTSCYKLKKVCRDASLSCTYFGNPDILLWKMCNV